MKDNEAMFWDLQPGDGLATNSDVVDLGGAVRGMGPGEEISCFLTISNLDQTAYPTIQLEVWGSIDGAAFAQQMNITLRATDAAWQRGDRLAFHLPSNIRRHVALRISTALPASNLVTAGINLDQQTNG